MHSSHIISLTRSKASSSRSSDARESAYRAPAICFGEIQYRQTDSGGKRSAVRLQLLLEASSMRIPITDNQTSFERHALI